MTGRNFYFWIRGIISLLRLFVSILLFVGIILLVAYLLYCRSHGIPIK